MGKGTVRWGALVFVVLLLALFALRMEVATSVPSVSYDSYLLLRNVEHIQETGAPINDDTASLTGQTRVGSPLFAYILSFLALISPAMYKILPNLFMVLLLLPVYYLTLSFTKSKVAAVFSAILAASAPAVFSSYLNTPSSSPLAIGVFLTILAMLQNPNAYVRWIVGLTLFLTFLSPIVFVLVLSLIMVILLIRIEGFGLDKRMSEIFFFTLVLSVWFHVLVFKRALFLEGIRVLWQNLPTKYVALQFATVTFLDLIYGLGVITFLFGVFGTYHALFEQRNKSAYTIIGAELAVFSMMIVRVIEIRLGLLLLSLLLAIMAGHGLLTAGNYVKRTKAPWLVYPLGGLAILLFIMTALIPATASAQEAIENTPSQKDVLAFTSLQTTLPRGTVLLTTIREGAAVQYFSGHTTVSDDDFLLLNNGDELVRDIDGVYNARFSVSLPSKAEKLGFTHIIFSENAQEQYERDRILVEESACVTVKPLSSSSYIYTVTCRGEPQ